MIGLDRQGWILVGFAVLFFSAIVVSAFGWILVWRTRRSRSARATDSPPGEEPEAPAEEASLPPGNPPR